MAVAKTKNYEAYSIGRRKSSVARVYLLKGTGKITINHREFQEYFKKGTNQYQVKQPLELLGVSDKYDIRVNVQGGGTTGQAGAVRLGIARSLDKLVADSHTLLKTAGFLT
ncbi:MAG: 30S ribosomal protein S9, partial [Bacteriovoracaceae bacterium]|nr:30S ribosomal protein S9 [Bacteriovoracaceae bacterium]